MKSSFVRDVLERLRRGEISVEEALEELRDFPFLDLEHTKLDTLRELRKGIPEIIYGEGKSLEELLEILRPLRARGEDVLVTRVRREIGEVLKTDLKEGVYDSIARCFYLKEDFSIKGKGTVLVVSAGTSDRSVAEEAYVTSVFLGNQTERLYDVGIAGIHRLTAHKDLLKKARVIICVAGMEGALPSIIAGVVSVPVLGVPTSCGYGASFSGLAALLTMLNSCSTLAVFNIDNGFGAAYFATLINRL